MLLLFFGDYNDTSLTRRARGLTMLEFVVLSIGAFFQSARYSVVLRYASVMRWYATDRIDVIGSLGLHCWASTLSVDSFI